MDKDSRAKDRCTDLDRRDHIQSKQDHTRPNDDSSRFLNDSFVMRKQRVHSETLIQGTLAVHICADLDETRARADRKHTLWSEAAGQDRAGELVEDRLEAVEQDAVHLLRDPQRRLHFAIDLP